MRIKTPYYLIDESKLIRNLEIIRHVREKSGAKALLALKCFSTWAVFPLMRKYMDGTTSSSPYEVRLGAEKFGGETHAYSVAYSKDDVRDVVTVADKIIFNSLSQLKTFGSLAKGIKTGLRINPGISFSGFDLADPSRKFSRLGVSGIKEALGAANRISGAMFHFNCENDDFKALKRHIGIIGRQYAPLLKKIEWVSLGGGIFFTRKGYPVDEFCCLLRDFSGKFKVQVYLEPGETAITDSAELVTTVLDVVHNKADIAIVDASTEAHMLDLLIYRQCAKMDTARFGGKHEYVVAGRSCLAGDVFGTFKFPGRLYPGDNIRFIDAAGYSMVKKNWFNGLSMPSIVVKRLDGSLETTRIFNYIDFRDSLSKGGRKR